MIGVVAMKDNIDNVIRKKYKEVEIPQLDLDKFQIEKNYKGYKVAALILMLVMTIIGLKMAINQSNSNTNKDNALPQNLVAKDDTELPVATETITVGLDMMSIAFLDVDYVAIIKVNEILGYTNYSSIQNRYLWPITKLEVTVEKSLKGDLKGTIQINRYGGVISIANWEKTLSKERIERYGYNKLSKEEKENTYVDIIMGPSYGKAEQGKKYLVFLRQDKETYDGLTISAGYMEEYDEKTESTRYGNGWLPIKDNIFLQQVLENN